MEMAGLLAYLGIAPPWNPGFCAGTASDLAISPGARGTSCRVLDKDHIENLGSWGAGMVLFLTTPPSEQWLLTEWHKKKHLLSTSKWQTFFGGSLKWLIVSKMMVQSGQAAEGSFLVRVYIELTYCPPWLHSQTCHKACGLISREVFLQSDMVCCFFFLLSNLEMEQKL